MKHFIKQAISFIGLSGIGWILDFCTYTGLSFVSNNLVLNNIISSWIGVSFVFIFATRKVFKNNSNYSLVLKYLLYIAYQMVLIYCISKLLSGINIFIINNIKMEIIRRFSLIISKIVVTPITMILNFFVMKGVIEKL